MNRSNVAQKFMTVLCILLSGQVTPGDSKKIVTGKILHKLLIISTWFQINNDGERATFFLTTAGQYSFVKRTKAVYM